MRWPSTLWGGTSVITLSLIALALGDAFFGQMVGLLACGAILLGAGTLVAEVEDRLAARARAAAPPAPPVARSPVARPPAPPAVGSRGKKGARPGKGRKQA